jgi:hypothetical protein
LQEEFEAEMTLVNTSTQKRRRGFIVGTHPEALPREKMEENRISFFFLRTVSVVLSGKDLRDAI